MNSAGSSPLSRGIRSGDIKMTRGTRIIPALAGNTIEASRAVAERPDHPRSRGEYDAVRSSVKRGKGSSPLSRGIHRPRQNLWPIQRIIPALAGNTRSWQGSAEAEGDHPRSRGEYKVELRPEEQAAGSSPLSRGIRIVPGCSVQPGRIIPALAGNTYPVLPVLRLSLDHPRSRGEYFPHPALDSRAGGSSPLSRGIRPQRPGSYGTGRIIPALAGNTLWSGHLRLALPDHPRSRGEYLMAQHEDDDQYGSSPLSRGIHPTKSLFRVLPRIIPALAGNTST